MTLDWPAGCALPRRLAEDASADVSWSSGTRTAIVEATICDAVLRALPALVPEGKEWKAGVTVAGEVTVGFFLGNECFCEQFPYGQLTLAEAAWVGRGIAFRISERISAGGWSGQAWGVEESAAE